MAVQAVERSVLNKRRLASQVWGVVRLLGLSSDYVSRALGRLERLDDSELGKGYGYAPASAHHAVAMAEQLGLSVDPLYAGRALSVMFRALEASEGRALLRNTHSAIVDNTPPS